MVFDVSIYGIVGYSYFPSPVNCRASAAVQGRKGLFKDKLSKEINNITWSTSYFSFAHLSSVCQSSLWALSFTKITTNRTGWGIDLSRSLDCCNNDRFSNFCKLKINQQNTWTYRVISKARPKHSSSMLVCFITLSSTLSNTLSWLCRRSY